MKKSQLIISILIMLSAYSDLLAQNSKSNYILTSLEESDGDEGKYGKIQYNFFQLDKNLKIGNVNNEIDLKEVLSKVYPSYQYDRNAFYDNVENKESQVKYEERFASAWTCLSCPKSKFYMEDGLSSSDKPGTFPFKINLTHILNHFKYVSNNITYEVVFFSTQIFNPYDGFATGRQSHGVLSASVFKKVGDIWELSSFSPAIAAQGDFGDAEAPSKIINNENGIVLFELIGGNVNGSPSYEGLEFFEKDYRLYGFVEGRIEEIIVIKSGEIRKVENPETNANTKVSFWNSTLSSMNDGIHSKYPIIEITTIGYFDASNFEGYESIEEFPQFKKGEKCDFTWKRRFSPSSVGKYKLISSEIK